MAQPQPLLSPGRSPSPAAVVEAPKTEIGNTCTEIDILLLFFIWYICFEHYFYFFLFLIRTSVSYTMSTLRFINQCLLVFPSSSLPFSFLSLEFNLPFSLSFYYYSSPSLNPLLLILFFISLHSTSSSHFTTFFHIFLPPLLNLIYSTACES